ncbi:hypothetical protein J6590_015221 [Homalodisca vitripennis]|nr:hypothetical protein J6590_015221 [Homalodisca vitripennis]
MYITVAAQSIVESYKWAAWNRSYLNGTVDPGPEFWIITPATIVKRGQRFVISPLAIKNVNRSCPAAQTSTPNTTAVRSSKNTMPGWETGSVKSAAESSSLALHLGEQSALSTTTSDSDCCAHVGLRGNSQMAYISVTQRETVLLNMISRTSQRVLYECTRGLTYRAVQVRYNSRRRRRKPWPGSRRRDCVNGSIVRPLRVTRVTAHSRLDDNDNSSLNTRLTSPAVTWTQ